MSSTRHVISGSEEDRTLEKCINWPNGSACGKSTFLQEFFIVTYVNRVCLIYECELKGAPLDRTNSYMYDLIMLAHDIITFYANFATVGETFLQFFPSDTEDNKGIFNTSSAVSPTCSTHASFILFIEYTILCQTVKWFICRDFILCPTIQVL